MKTNHLILLPRKQNNNGAHRWKPTNECAAGNKVVMSRKMKKPILEITKKLVEYIGAVKAHGDTGQREINKVIFFKEDDTTPMTEPDKELYYNEVICECGMIFYGEYKAHICR